MLSNSSTLNGFDKNISIGEENVRYMKMKMLGGGTCEMLS